MTNIEVHEKNRNINAGFGFYISVLTAIITIIAFGVAVMTPPLSGPFCTENCFEYPYTEIASRYPRDYYFMYPTILVSVCFVLLINSIHQYAVFSKKIYSRIGLSFAIISATILISNYFIQISVVQPSLLKGETEGIALITQYNPHGIFIALDEIGFLLMNFSFFSIIPVFTAKTGIFKAIRWTYLLGFILAVFSLILISIKYGIMREYIFEVAIISIVWIELIISSILLSFVFKAEMKKEIQS